MKWLAVDYGDARTGLAACDASETVTAPITPQIEEKSMNKAAAAAAAAAAQRGAEGLVCGLPRNMDGSEGARAAKSRRFAQRLADAAGLPVVLWDERRTTVSAAAILAGNDTFGTKRKSGWTRSRPPSFWKVFCTAQPAPRETPPDCVLPQPRTDEP